MDAVLEQAPAKINLVLRVGARRADGYHELVSLMAAVDLADGLTVARDARVTVDCPGLPGGDTLVTRALEAFREASGYGGGFRVVVAKRIPVGAGLGGGSSDAAAALRAANRLAGTPLGPDALAAVAAGIGSDVPFFLGPPVAVVRGRGERIEAGPALPPVALVLAHPGIALATRDVYEAYRPTGEPLPRSLPPVTTIDRLAAAVANDLAPIAERLVPACRTIREGLVERGALAAAVTGSGSAVFGVFATPAEAEAAAVGLAGAAWTRAATLRVP